MLCLEERRLLVLKRGIIRKIGSIVAMGDEVVVLNYKSRYIEDHRSYIEDHRILLRYGHKILVQVAQSGGRYPVPENIQGQVRQGSELPDLVKDVPAHCRKLLD